MIKKKYIQYVTMHTKSKHSIFKLAIVIQNIALKQEVELKHAYLCIPAYNNLSIFFVLFYLF